MKKLLLQVCWFLLAGVQPVAAQNFPDMRWTKRVGAARLQTVKAIFNVTDYGAVPDTSITSTVFIQKAIDACAKKGGGAVAFKPGTYVSGALFIKTNVELRISEGVTLLGSQRFEDYPEIATRIAGIEMKWPAALINIIDAKYAALTGKGIINARGKFCWDKYWQMRKEYEAKGLRWVVDYDAKRVRTVLVQRSSNIIIREVTIKNAGFWTVQLLYADHITVDALTVRNNEDGKGPSTDGVDVDSSTWILIQNCDIDCNDDDFCLKAGRDWDGLRVNKPTEYVVIRNCIARRGGGMLTLGSETSGGIRHVLATGLTGKGTGNGFHIKSATTRGGTVEDIHFQHCTLDSVGNAFMFTMNWNPTYSYSSLPAGYSNDSIPAHWQALLHKVIPASAGIPHFKNIFIESITAAGVKKIISAAGLKESLLQQFHFKEVKIEGKLAGDITNADGWTFEHVFFTGADKQRLKLTDATAMRLENN